MSDFIAQYEDCQCNQLGVFYCDNNLGYIETFNFCYEIYFKNKRST